MPAKDPGVRKQKLHEGTRSQLAFPLDESGVLGKCFKFSWATETGTVASTDKLSGSVSLYIPPFVDIVLYQQLKEFNLVSCLKLTRMVATLRFI